jgi:hypothetical protein
MDEQQNPTPLFKSPYFLAYLHSFVLWLILSLLSMLIRDDLLLILAPLIFFGGCFQGCSIWSMLILGIINGLIYSAILLLPMKRLLELRGAFKQKDQNKYSSRVKVIIIVFLIPLVAFIAWILYKVLPSYYLGIPVHLF